MLALVFAAQILAAAPAPAVTVSDTHPRTLADVARERRLGTKGVGGGTLSVAGAPVATGNAAAAIPKDKAAAEAQERMSRAVKDGAWTKENIHYHGGIINQSAAEWDNAALNCRATPGCNPTYRDSVEISAPLKTFREQGCDLPWQSRPKELFGKCGGK